MSAGLALDEELACIAASKKLPQLMLHCCCAPCASYVLEYLSPYFGITILFYNPNIQPIEEYNKRASEFQKLTASVDYPNGVKIITCDYDTGIFTEAAAPFREEPEGGRRCRVCFELRLGETAKRAKEGGYDFFATTLSVSPHKNAAALNEIGSDFEGKFGVRFLRADFKKRDGYKRSIALSKQFGLYRQNYCGCAWSAV